MGYPPAPPQGPPSDHSGRGRHQAQTQLAAVASPRNGVGVAAAAVAGLAMLCALIPPITSMGGMLGIVAVIVALVAITRVALRKATNMPVSVTALGLGLAAIVTATAISQIMG